MTGHQSALGELVICVLNALVGILTCCNQGHNDEECYFMHMIIAGKIVMREVLTYC